MDGMSSESGGRLLRRLPGQPDDHLEGLKAKCSAKGARMWFQSNGFAVLSDGDALPTPKRKLETMPNDLRYSLETVLLTRMVP